MKRIGLIVPLGTLLGMLLACVPGARAQCSSPCIAHASAVGSSPTTNAVDATGATLMVAVIASFNSSGSFVQESITDSAGNSSCWTFLSPTGVLSSGRDNLQMDYCCNPPSTSSSETWSSTGAGGFIDVEVFSGTFVAGCLDTGGSPSAGAVGSGTGASPGSGTPSGTDIFVAGAGSDQCPGAISITGWNTTDQDTNCADEEGAMAWVQTSSTQNPTWSGGTNTQTSNMAWFKQSGGPPPCSRTLATLHAGCP